MWRDGRKLDRVTDRLRPQPPQPVVATVAVLLALSTLLTSLAIAPSVLAAQRVQVRGTSRLEVRASGPRHRLQVAGTLRDETGTPVSDAPMIVRAMVDGSVSVPWDAVGTCAQDGPRSGGSRSEQTVMTDSMGEFCLVGAIGRTEATVQVVFGGGPLHDGTRTDVVWNAQQRPLSIRFSPRPERIDLDAPRVMVFARVRTPPGQSRQGLELHLTGSDGRELASSLTDAAGSTHFDFSSTLLEGPGIGVMRVSFAGRDDLAPASATATVTRTMRVRLSTEHKQVSGHPERGVPVRIMATTARGPVTGGTVEATLKRDVIGVGPVLNGSAEVVMAFRQRRDERIYGVVFRYRPDAPYYEGAGTIGVTVLAEQPSPWLRAVPVVLVILVAAWLLRGWRRPKRREAKPVTRPTVTGEPSLSIVGASSSREQWRGRVVDAHDAKPIPDARIRVIVPTFVELDVVVEERTDSQGRFEFLVQSYEKQLRLRVESTYHAAMERPLPPPSDVVIALVSRRRALVDRLVKWARRAGRPWYREPDPTPGHVARIAKGQHRHGDAVALWAKQVQQRAYGPDPVDARSEEEVNDLEPSGQPLR